MKNYPLARLLGLLLTLPLLLVACNRDPEQISTESPTTRYSTADNPAPSALPDSATTDTVRLR